MLSVIKPKLAVLTIRFLLVGIVALVGIGIFFDVCDDVTNQKKDSLFMVDQRLSSLFFEINNFPRGPGQDVVFLGQLNSLKEYLADKQKNDHLTDDLRAYLNQSEAYHAIRYIGLSEDEEIYISQDRHNIADFPGDAEYKDLMGTLNVGSVYISPLHHDKVNGETITAFNYITPVFNSVGDKVGLIVLTIDASYFLDDIRNYSKPDEKVYLIDSRGFYLAHPEKSKEFVSGKDSFGSFVDDYSDIGEEILTSDERRLENDDYVFSLRRIYPTASGFELLGDNYDDSYHWILVSVREQPKTQGFAILSTGDLALGHLTMFGLVLLMSVLGLVGTAYLNKSNKNQGL